MHYREYARTILEGSSIEDKLLPAKDLDLSERPGHIVDYDLPNNPGRTTKLAFNNEQVKFPRSASFHLEEKRGLALHFFANHELLAIEMMAAALLVYPNTSVQFKKGLIKTIQDEQKHLKMYIARMREFGIELGEFPLNDFFWRSMEKLETPSHFYSAMAMTFEAANLDFAQFYEEGFRAVEDFKTADIMRVVLEDEISHVALGAHWLNQWRGDKDLWNYYKTHLPGVMTPARAKGIHFDKEIRKRAGLDQEF
ncbi:MAG: ferritin-like domain-containing protein, partial [Bdellovibrionales bacterium]|nr:ferritin-like domain-containing protein [Bdellovibrionales bacterium]